MKHHSTKIVVLIAVLAFAVGALAGVVAQMSFMDNGFKRNMDNFFSVTDVTNVNETMLPRKMHLFMKIVGEDLKLTAEQRVFVENVLESHLDDFRAMRESNKKAAAVVAGALVADIEPIMNEEQNRILAERFGPFLEVYGVPSTN